MKWKGSRVWKCGGNISFLVTAYCKGIAAQVLTINKDVIDIVAIEVIKKTIKGTVLSI